MPYKTIDDSIWWNREYKRLDELSRLLFMYFVTNPHAHFTGLYYIPKELIALETGFSIEKIDRGMIPLSRVQDTAIQSLKQHQIGVSDIENIENHHFFIVYDPDHQVIWVKSMLRYQSGDKVLNAKQLKGVCNHLRTYRRIPMIVPYLKYYRAYFRQTVDRANHDDKLLTELVSLYRMHSLPFFSSDSYPYRTASETATESASETESDSVSESASLSPALLPASPDCDVSLPVKKKRGPANKRQKKAIDYDVENTNLITAFNGLGPLVMNYIAMVAGLNSTGTIQQSKEHRILMELAEMRKSSGDDDLFRRAILKTTEKQAANLNYMRTIIDGERGKRYDSRRNNTKLPSAAEYEAAELRELQRLQRLQDNAKAAAGVSEGMGTV